jgi:hypothetical protein
MSHQSRTAFLDECAILWPGYSDHLLLEADCKTVHENVTTPIDKAA